MTRIHTTGRDNWQPRQRITDAERVRRYGRIVTERRGLLARLLGGR